MVSMNRIFPILRLVRRMSYLASRYTGRGDVHVVDPAVDLRYIFENTEKLRRSIEERRSNVDITQVKEKYDAWWDKYQAWKASADQSKEVVQSMKNAMRDEQAGLLSALALPNFVHEVGNTEKPMLKSSRHQQYLSEKGRLHVDEKVGVVHLIGYPVLMQNCVKSQLLDMFSYAILVSPSCFVRAAILEAVNVPLAECIRFNDGSETFPATFLVGHSLHSLVSLFMRSRFSSQSNTWPITVHTAGVAYYNKKGIVDLAHSRQRLKHCVLALANSNEQMDGFASECAAKIKALLCDDLMLEVKNRSVLGKELSNYESQAVVFEDGGLELARISRIGDYIARRLNITMDSGEFVRMAYVETDVDRILVRLIDRLIDGKDIPKSLLNLVRVDDFV